MKNALIFAAKSSHAYKSWSPDVIGKGLGLGLETYGLGLGLGLET